MHLAVEPVWKKHYKQRNVSLNEVYSKVPELCILRHDICLEKDGTDAYMSWNKAFVDSRRKVREEMYTIHMLCANMLASDGWQACVLDRGTIMLRVHLCNGDLGLDRGRHDMD